MRPTHPVTPDQSGHRRGLAVLLAIGLLAGCGRSDVPKTRLKAERGDSKAQSRLGLMYSNGQGVKKDPSEAIKWFRRAAEQGNAEAECSLGLLYLEGAGVPPDPVEAYKWLSLSASQGVDFAGQVLKDLKRRMTSDQIIEGESRTALFAPHKESVAPRPNS